MKRVTLLWAALTVATATGSGGMAPPAPHPTGEPERQAVVHLLDRATFGARPEDVERVERIGRAVWLDEQLHPERIGDDSMRARLTAFPTIGMSSADLLARFAPPEATEALRRARAGVAVDTAALARARREAASGRRRLLADLVGAKLVRAVYSRRQLEEVMTDFWFNHFNVFAGKGPIPYLIADYERTAIRPHVFGRFEDLLRATAQHPAMLFFLDNVRSTAADSARTLAYRPRRFPARTAAGGVAAGINENYARELMELHTLGADQGYTQADVIDVARAFTGWSVRRAGVAFVFRPGLHDAGEKSVMGRRLPAGRGMEDGLDVLHMLATSPTTARHIATELATWFVADYPPPALVDRLTETFLRTDGDLREVTRTLFSAPGFYDASTYGAKVRTPFQYVVAALRTTRAEVRDTRPLVGVLRALGQLPYLQSSPAGWPSESADWVSSGALLGRMNLGLGLAAGRLPGTSVDDGLLRAQPRMVVEAVLPAVEPEAMLARLDDAAETAAGPDAPDTLRAAARDARVLTLGLALGSPEFQRH